MKRILSVAILFLSGAASAESARELESDVETTSAPVEPALAGRAQEEFRAGKNLSSTAKTSAQWESAHAHFSASFQLAHEPFALWNMASCSIEGGRFARALEESERFLTESNGRNPVYENRARENIAKLWGVVSAVSIRTVPEDAIIAIDGEPSTFFRTRSSIPVDPGSHTIRIERNGFAPQVVTRAFEARQREELSIELRRTEPAQKTGPTSPSGAQIDVPELALGPTGSDSAPDAVQPETPKTEAIRSPWAWTAVGIGVAALSGGVYEHLRARQEADSMLAQCDGKSCYPGAMQNYDSSQSAATAAVILYGIGLACVTTGGVLFALGSASGTGSPSIRARIGPDSIRFDGTF